MKLKKPVIVFAHSGEAQAFRASRKFDQLNSGAEEMLESGDTFLFLCGEGHQYCLPKVATLLRALADRISCVVNLGVAGSLRAGFRPGDMVPVRKIILEDNGNAPIFSTMTPDAEAVLVTAHSRVTDDQTASRLSEKADLVDREAWAICKAAARHRLPVICTKLISDRAGFASRRVNFRKESRRWSEMLFQYYCEVLKPHM